MDVSILNRPLLLVADTDSSPVNEARALRITEVMTDFQNLQRRISEYAPNPPPEEYYEQGYEVLRQCRAEAQANLMAPYPPDTLQIPGSPEEQEKRQLQR